MRAATVLAQTMAVLMLVGCYSDPPSPTPTPDQIIARAHDHIERIRAERQALVDMAPIERAVQEALDADPRVASARFAMPLNDVGLQMIFDDDRLMVYALVLTVREPLDEAQVRGIVLSALDKGGLRAHTSIELVHDGNEWAVSSFAVCYLDEDQDPDPSLPVP